MLEMLNIDPFFPSEEGRYIPVLLSQHWMACRDFAGHKLHTYELARLLNYIDFDFHHRVSCDALARLLYRFIAGRLVGLGHAPVLQRRWLLIVNS